MLVGKLEDLTGSVTILIFHDDKFEEKMELFQDDHLVKISGRLRINSDELSVNCQDIELLERVDGNKSYYIDADGLDTQTLTKIRTLNLQFKGTFPVYLKIADKTIQAHRKFWVIEDELYQSQLEMLVGKGRVWIV